MKNPRPFGKYYLLERVNVGGMAEVFKAKLFGSDGFEKILAIKRILPNIAEDEEFITMFRDEAMISVQLTHPNIAQITDLNKVDDVYYIAMEYVHGKDVRTIFERCRAERAPMSIAQACFIVMKVCEALDYAHNKKDDRGKEIGIVHRDISPQNVLISYEGDVKVIDFGIAKAAGKASKTQAGILKGKFGYMSPEQVRGNVLDRRSDIFSLGIVLYELLTNERLFIGESDFSTLEKVRNVEILPPSTYNRKIPEQLESIILRALAKEVEDRYQNGVDFHDELQAFMYTSGEFYSRKDLSTWMKKTFSREIMEEQTKLDEYSKFKPDMNTLKPEPHFSMLDDPTFTPSISMTQPAESDEEEWWEDDEVETALYDKPDQKPSRGQRKPRPAPAPDVTERPEIKAPAQQSFSSSQQPAAPMPSGPVPAVSQPRPVSSGPYPAQNAPMQAAVPVEKPSGGSFKYVILAVMVLSVAAAFVVWKFVLNKPVQKTGGAGAIEISVTPADNVTVKLNGAELKDENGAVVKKFPFRLQKEPGFYEIEVSGKGFLPYKDKVKVESNVVNKLNISLKRDVFKIFIEGKPESASVTIGGTSYNEKTPWKGMDLASGTHTILIAQGDLYHPFKVTETKKAGEILDIKYDLVPKKATISIRTLTKGAKICLVTDNTKNPADADCPVENNTPYELITLPDVKYFLKVVKPGYKPFSTPIDFKGSTTWTLPLAVALEKKAAGNTHTYVANNNMNPPDDPMPPMIIDHTMQMDPDPPMPPMPPMIKEPSGKTGTLRINARPRSQVFVDGALKGYTPRKLTLSAGTHRITLVNNENRKVITVNITPGKSITRVVTF
ncbi:protein kinase [Myxococcota bacterium]|nr:protein kinase [Myxococcota bacterium]MBU1379992.1 protein kinase [Myxococcota bacterium]MBU1496749.1 protein kinase [Myxococcota bacterium]